MATFIITDGRYFTFKGHREHVTTLSGGHARLFWTCSIKSSWAKADWDWDSEWFEWYV